MDKFMAIVKSIFNTKDHSSSFDRTDLSSNKGMNILCYFGILVIIPILVDKTQSRYLKFNENQGLLLLILSVLGWIVFNVLGAIPILGIIFNIIGWVWNVIIIAFCIYGILNVVNGKAKELPFIGNITLLK